MNWKTIMNAITWLGWPGDHHWPFSEDWNVRFNWKRLKISWILWSGNRHASSRAYWGWVSIQTALAASIGWGPWWLETNP